MAGAELHVPWVAGFRYLERAIAKGEFGHPKLYVVRVLARVSGEVLEQIVAGLEAERIKDYGDNMQLGIMALDDVTRRAKMTELHY
jgi:16S rRNA U516 pseudouridylate synthase RsuA-like enzyme